MKTNLLVTNRVMMVLFVCGLVAFGASNAHAQAARALEAIAIGPVTALGGLSNDFPVKAVGQELKSGQLTAFVFDENERRKRTLPLVPGDSANSSSIATDISADGGDAVGQTASRATDWPVPGGSITNPGHFPSPQACSLGFPNVTAVNDNRVAVGSCGVFEPQGTRPLRWSITTQFNAAVLPTDFIEGFNILQSGKALDVNNNGIIVGEQGGKAAIWMDPNQIPLVFNLVEARGISNGSILNGNLDLVTMIGPIGTQGGPQTRGINFVLAGGGISFIGSTRLPFTNFGPNVPQYLQYLMQDFIGAETRKINRTGMIAGHMKHRNGGTIAALWHFSGAPFNLAANTSGLPAGTVLTDAIDINDQGYVLAKGTVNGQLQGFILRPTGVAFISAGQTY